MAQPAKRRTSPNHVVEFLLWHLRSELGRERALSLLSTIAAEHAPFAMQVFMASSPSDVSGMLETNLADSKSNAATAPLAAKFMSSLFGN